MPHIIIITIITITITIIIIIIITSIADMMSSSLFPLFYPFCSVASGKHHRPVLWL
jgi:hypothetical protein